MREPTAELLETNGGSALTLRKLRKLYSKKHPQSRLEGVVLTINHIFFSVDQATPTKGCNVVLSWSMAFVVLGWSDG